MTSCTTNIAFKRRLLPIAVHYASRYLVLLAISVWAVSALAAEASDLELLEQQAFQAAVERVAPSVVRIETVGGRERVGKLLFGVGPTTGLIVSEEGYIVSSAFNFLHRPTSILVRLPGGPMKAAKLVATDHSRMLVLLKVEPEVTLPVPEIVPHDEMHVGQWAIAVGRTFEADRPNMAVGILSAAQRVWGTAIQTDAAVSPNNYGGPLIDIRGRVLGVLVPLSPHAADELAGYQWYDSGIGFAIPAEHIMKILPRLRQGALFGGVIGVTFRDKNLSIGEPVIAACQSGSPAAQSGLKPGDRIVEINGHEVTRIAGVKEQLHQHYAGDRVHIVVLRDGKHIERQMQLAPKPVKKRKNGSELFIDTQGEKK